MSAALFVVSSLAVVPASADSVEWSEPLPIGDDSQIPYEIGPSIAANAQGYQVAAWNGQSISSSVFVNRFVPETGWAGVESMGPGEYAVVGIDGAGSSTVSWSADGMILARTYLPEQGAWTELTIVSDTAGYDSMLDLSVNDDGGAGAVWRYWNGANWEIHASIRDQDLSWSDATPIKELQYRSTIWPTIAVDDAMNAIVLGSEYDGYEWNVFAIQYVHGQGWGEETIIDNQIGLTYEPEISMNGDGVAIAVWGTLADSIYVPFANVYSPESGWGVACPIEDQTSTSSILIDVDIDENGEAIAAWRLAAPQWTESSIRANLYNPASGWSGPTTVGEVEGPVSGVPVDVRTHAATDDGAYVAWNDCTEYFTSWNLYANYYDRADGWMGTSLLSEAANISRIGITSNHLGGATIAWAASYDYYDWDIYVSSCSGSEPASEDPTSVMSVFEGRDWKTWKFDGRESTDDGRVVDYLWDFGDGNYADKKVSWHTYQKAGDYTVTLTVWDDEGNSDSTSITLAVRPNP